MFGRTGYCIRSKVGAALDTLTVKLVTVIPPRASSAVTSTVAEPSATPRNTMVLPPCASADTAPMFCEIAVRTTGSLSGSVTEIGTAISSPTVRLWSGIGSGWMTGALFAPVTVTVKAVEAVPPRPSSTSTVTFAWPGVTPLTSTSTVPFATAVATAGLSDTADTISGSLSASATASGTLMLLPASTDCGPICPIVGALFALSTSTPNVTETSGFTPSVTASVTLAWPAATPCSVITPGCVTDASTMFGALEMAVACSGSPFGSVAL